MAQAISVLLRLLVISTIVERVQEIILLALEYFGKANGKSPPACMGSAGSTENIDARPASDQRPALPPEIEAAKRSRKRVILQLTGSILGGLIAWGMGFAVFAKLGFTGLPYWLDVVLTGMLVGGGTEPIHSLIKFLEENKDKAAAETQQVQIRALVPSRVTATLEGDTLGISYSGGLYPERQGQKPRTHNPQKIIYHHTATHSNTPFEKIVEIEKARDLDPSYHCVVTSDAEYHHYCRWDGVGWHAKGANLDSLGIALVGNFETDPTVEGNNADARCGNREPSTAQRKTAARVVALWMSLYSIALEQVIPHSQIKPTACPGSNFPHDAFKQDITAFLTEWVSSPTAQQELEEFKQQRFIYV